MKHISFRFDYFGVVAVGVTLVLMAALMGSPAVVSAQPAPQGSEMKVSRSEAVEARIKDYRAKLKITADQEEQWGKVAEAMRENAATMDALIKTRDAGIGSMNAVDNLKSYSKIADAHAAGLTKFISVFEPLYVTMSDEQKKNADKIFTNRPGHKRSKRK